MSEISKKNIVKYTLDKTYRTFEEATLLAKNEYWDTVINRLYYSSFYALKAYLICKEIDTNTHQATKNALHRELIKTTLLHQDFGKYYNRLFVYRNEADYEILKSFNETTVNTFFPIVKSFITEIEKIIASNSDCLDD